MAVPPRDAGVSRPTLRYILNCIDPLLAIETPTEDPISRELRLALCLYRLGHGDYLHTIAEFRGIISVFSLSSIISLKQGSQYATELPASQPLTVSSFSKTEQGMQKCSMPLKEVYFVFLR